MPKNLVRTTLWITISEIIFNISGFFIHTVMGRILGPADYGRYGIVVTLTTMVIILVGNGIPTAMAKYLSEIFETKPHLISIIKKQAILLQSVIVGTITILFFIFSPLIAKLLGDATLTPLFRLSTLIIPSFAMASFYFSYYTGLHQFNIQSILKVFRSIFKIIFILLFAYFWKLEGSISGYIVAPLTIFFIALAIDKFKISKQLKRTPKFITEIKQKENFDWRLLINYAWQIIIFFLAYELLISIDLYMVKAILKSDYSTGIYNASLTLARIPYYIFYSLTVILLPVISKTTSQNNHTQTAKIINQSLRLMLILLVPMIVLMSVFAQPLIRLFYSSRYESSALPMTILVLGVGFLTIYYVFCFVMSGANKVKKPMLISIFGLFLNIILNYFLIKKYALVGSSIATSITSIVITFIMLYYIWKDFGVKISLKFFSKIIIAGTLMLGVSQLLPSQEKFTFIFWSFLLFIFYLDILYVLGEIGKKDMLIIKSLTIKKNNKNNLVSRI